MMKKIMGAMRNPVRIVQFCSRRGWLAWMDDEAYLKLVYKMKFGKALNLEDPKTFNEKLQWLKLYDRKPEYTRLVDKYEVRDYIAKEIGDQYLIPLVGGPWDRFEDIDFNALPNQFVLKCTHDSGSVIICRDKEKLDREAAKKKLNRCLKNNGYNFGREWPYKDVKPRIVAEQYMTGAGGAEVEDYKIHCFHGEPKFILVCRDRFASGGLTEDFFTPEWEHMPIRRQNHPNAAAQIPAPETLAQMLELAKMLSADLPFARIDFYEIKGKIYFGEITFYPASGFAPFVPESWDDTFGEWLTLPPTKAER